MKPHIKKQLLICGIVVGVLLTLSPFAGFLLGVWECLKSLLLIMQLPSGNDSPGHVDIRNEILSLSAGGSGFTSGMLLFGFSVNASNFLCPIGVLFTGLCLGLYASVKKTPPPLPTSSTRETVPFNEEDANPDLRFRAVRLFKRHALLFSFIALIAVSFLSIYCVQNIGFTKWMTLSELNAFMDTFKADIPGQPNYWDKGHWITAVEGRWQYGIPQYRIRYGETPKHQGHWWYWYINQPEDSFNKKILEYADDGFTLVYHNKYTLPDGSQRFQGVWHKLAKKK